MRAFAFGIVLLACLPGFASEPPVVPVWPGKPPGEVEALGEEVLTGPKQATAPEKWVRTVSLPTMTIYRPAPDKDTGASVIIAPGGGYYLLAWDKEGTEVAERFNAMGVTGIVLKYRVPRRKGTANDVAPPQALMDAQRAVSKVRFMAKEWKLDPDRIGMLGFSAGGHLTAWTATNSDERSYEPIDDADKVSCRPDWCVLVYPAYLLKPKTEELAADIRVSKDTPPCFFVHASDDPIRSENSAIMYVALRKAVVPAELHIYGKGGHGFGLRKSDNAICEWPTRCEEWLKSRGILTAKKN